jgi:IS5 family transposase
MVRMYLLQIWFNLVNEETKDAIYDSYAMKGFIGIGFAEENVPDVTTLLNFLICWRKSTYRNKFLSG